MLLKVDAVAEMLKTVVASVVTTVVGEVVVNEFLLTLGISPKATADQKGGPPEPVEVRTLPGAPYVTLDPTGATIPKAPLELMKNLSFSLPSDKAILLHIEVLAGQEPIRVLAAPVQRLLPAPQPIHVFDPVGPV